MDIQIASEGAVMVIAIAGEIDHHTSEELREKIDKNVERSSCRHIILDFSQVTFMDSSGIGMIIGRYKMIEARGGVVSIAGMNRELNRIFTISGLAKIIRCYETVPDARLNIV